MTIAGVYGALGSPRVQHSGTAEQGAFLSPFYVERLPAESFFVVASASFFS